MVFGRARDFPERRRREPTHLYAVGVLKVFTQGQDFLEHEIADLLLIVGVSDFQGVHTVREYVRGRPVSLPTLHGVFLRHLYEKGTLLSREYVIEDEYTVFWVH